MKLYVKILLSFLLVFLISEILIFGLFMITAGRIFHSRVERFTQGKIIVAKAFLEDKIRSEPETPIEQNESLKRAVRFLADTHHAKIWIKTADGRMAAQSFSGPIPEGIAENPEEQAEKEKGMYCEFVKNRQFYACAVMNLADKRNTLHILFEKWADDSHRHYFGLGLLSIGAVIALLIIPVSRRITGPLKKLKISAMRIAEGDLSHRAEVSGKDEIGELGRSFNTMAGKVERMVRGGKELTANVSHELRSPLARINLAVELVAERLEKIGGDKIETHMKNIREDIEELDRLIDRILKLSKYDLQEQPLIREELSPADLMTELLERLRPGIDQKRLRLETDLSPGMVSADPEALRAALSNILDNAVKFSPEAGTVIAEIRSGENGLTIRVTNTAHSLSDTDLEMMFEPFHRVAHNSNASGTGLGLAITQKIVGRHGGTIRAFNSDRGLTVEIFLPTPE